MTSIFHCIPYTMISGSNMRFISSFHINPAFHFFDELRRILIHGKYVTSSDINFLSNIIEKDILTQVDTKNTWM